MVVVVFCIEVHDVLVVGLCDSFSDLCTMEIKSAGETFTAA